MADLRREFGLDRPLWDQLAIYVGNVARGDLGYSHRQKERVGTLILDRVPATLLLTGTAMLLAIALGVTLGALAAGRVGRWADSAITVLALVVYATPSFWIGLMFVLLFSIELGWLPAFGYETVGARHDGIALVVDRLRHLALPATTLGLFFVAVYARLTRGAMLEVAQMDFVRTARAKGLPEDQVTRRHVLRNALLPIVTFAGLQAGYLVGGSILIETVFAWPGIGRLAFEAVGARDYNLLLGVFITTSVMVIAFNLLTDLAYTLVDPRIELAA
jgi:peptide/nickel transport system permease protein